MTQIEQQEIEFQQQRAGYLALEQELNELKTEQQKAKSILSALQDELENSIRNAKDKLTLSGSLNVDDYVQLKSKETGLTARIEYYQALFEELDDRLYSKKEQIYKERERLFYMRGAIFSTLADNLLNKLSEHCKADLENIYNLLYLSNRFNPRPIPDTENSIEDQITEFIFNRLFNMIDKNTPIEPEYSLPNFIEEFHPKTPTQLHAESYSKTEIKGFQKLIAALTQK